ncbi:MAG: aminotransferase class IV [Candidatus Anstonellales archaeon]
MRDGGIKKFPMVEEMMGTDGGEIGWFGGEGKKVVRIVYWNGEFMPVEKAFVHPLNQGIQYSHAFFEGQRFYRMSDGTWVSFRYPEHFARFIASYWAIKGYDVLENIVKTVNTKHKSIVVETPSVEMLYREARKAYEEGKNPYIATIKCADLSVGHGISEGLEKVSVHPNISLFAECVNGKEKVRLSIRVPLVMYADGRVYTIAGLMELTKQLFALNNLHMLDADSFYYRPFATISNSPLKLQTFGKEVVLGLFPLAWGPYLGKGEVNVVVVPWKRISPEQFKTYAKMAGHYTNSVLSANLARAFGFTEGIMLDKDGNIAEGSAMNLFIVKNGIVYTPPLEVGILPGITRDSVINLLGFIGIEVVEKNLTIDDLLSADAAFFTGTAAEVMPLDSISVPKRFEKMREYDGIFSPSGKEVKLRALRFTRVKFNDENKRIAREVRKAFFDIFQYGSGTNKEFGEKWLQKMPDGKDKQKSVRRALVSRV